MICFFVRLCSSCGFFLIFLFLLHMFSNLPSAPFHHQLDAGLRYGVCVTTFRNYILRFGPWFCYKNYRALPLQLSVANWPTQGPCQNTHLHPACPVIVCMMDAPDIDGVETCLASLYEWSAHIGVWTRNLSAGPQRDLYLSCFLSRLPTQVWARRGLCGPLGVWQDEEVPGLSCRGVYGKAQYTLNHLTFKCCYF